jgi:hypothetical protein
VIVFEKFKSAFNIQKARLKKKKGSRLVKKKLKARLKVSNA